MAIRALLIYAWFGAPVVYGVIHHNIHFDIFGVSLILSMAILLAVLLWAHWFKGVPI